MMIIYFYSLLPAFIFVAPPIRMVVTKENHETYT